MTSKSYITLCIVAVIYVIMAAVAVVSPHGNRFAGAVSNSGDTQGQTDGLQAAGDQSTNAEQDTSILFTMSEDIEVYVPLSGMNTFSQTVITVNVNGEDKNFTAVHFKTLTDWSGLSYNSDWTVFKGKAGKIFACRSVDLQKEDNAYIIFADENGQPLDADTYGNFCLYVKDGSRKGFFDNVEVVDFG